jgi:hypothetical protein
MNRTLVAWLCSLADQPALASQFVRRYYRQKGNRALTARLLARIKT